MGAALYADRIHFGNPDRDMPDHPYWVRRLMPRARQAGAAGRPTGGRNWKKTDLIETHRARSFRSKDRRWMDGALELGPAGAGHRSILARRTVLEMRDRLNRDIKHREQFRPFAPVVPVEAAGTLFSKCRPASARLGRVFMSGRFPGASRMARMLAAVTHVDGTARVQALERGMAPRLYALLEPMAAQRNSCIAQHLVQLSGEPIVIARSKAI